MITDDHVLIVNETFGNRISAFDIRDDGQLAGQRVWAEVAPLPSARPIEQALAQLVAAPDGGCLDAEGAMWIADATGGRLLRVIEGGEVTDGLSPAPTWMRALWRRGRPHPVRLRRRTSTSTPGRRTRGNMLAIPARSGRPISDPVSMA